MLSNAMLSCGSYAAVQESIPVGSRGSSSFGCDPSPAPCQQAGRCCPAGSGTAVGALGPGIWRPHGAQTTSGRRAGESSHDEPYRGGVEAVWAGEDRDRRDRRAADSSDGDRQRRTLTAAGAGAQDTALGGDSQRPRGIRTGNPPEGRGTHGASSEAGCRKRIFSR